MSIGQYTITVRAVGELLTASKYNADHQNHVNNQTPQGTGAYSDTVAQMQIETYPGSLGAESLPTSLAGELERLRYQIGSIQGPGHYWYEQGFGLHQRQYDQTAYSNTSTGFYVFQNNNTQNFIGYDRGFYLRSCFDVEQNTGASQTLTVAVQWGGSTVLTETLTLSPSTTRVPILVEAWVMGRNATNLQFGFARLLTPTAVYAGGNPAMAIDNTQQQILGVFVTMGAANTNFIVTHGNSQMQRL